MSYRVLALDPNSRHMTLSVLRKVRDLANAGVAVVGPRPIESPSLADDQREFRALVDQLWGTGTVKGKLDAGRTIAQALEALGAPPDFEYAKPRRDTQLMFVHRKLADGEHLLGQQRRRPRRDPGSDIPRSGQSSRNMAAGLRPQRARVLQHRRRAHDRAAPARSP